MFRLLRSRLRGPGGWTELFAAANFAFLAVDIALAHATNGFAKWSEWIPLGFSIVAAPLLLAAFATGPSALSRRIGIAVGAGAVTVGIAGLILHLNSHFFQEQTLKSLVYTAPFAAPLAYTGLGLLVLLDRMVELESPDWATWILLLALGGFAGNFILSVADHAQNAFFHPVEWLAAAAAGLAVGFLFVAAFLDDSAPFRRVTGLVLTACVLVGVAGFVLHLRANLGAPGPLRERFLYGAPIFAPLLFADLAALAGLGMWGRARLED